MFHFEAPAKNGDMQKKFILKGDPDFCRLLGERTVGEEYKVLDPVVAAAYSFKYGGCSTE